ncbi:MAG: lytic transglycosylase domain-containing protein [Chloroflexi bacterium]|nr:lytic transglycosylase domain-containing protein [Chloroflexota bacterium]
MTYSSPTSSSEMQAAQNNPGCLRRFLIPPLAVVIMSFLLVSGLSKIDFVQAGSNPQPEKSEPIPIEGIAPLFTPEVQAWEEKILAWSSKYQLDPNLVATVMQIESCGYTLAKSGAGAKGLFQVMPYHFQDGENPFHPGTNAKRGLNYLRQALEAGGNNRLALAGYNGGITGAARPQEEWPEETVRYVYWGLKIYQDARAGLETSPRLNKWLDSGGASLCQLARNQ